MLRLTGLQKDYAGNVALRWSADASLEVKSGEIHGIVGENGAGKSTLFGVVAGLLPLSGGALELDRESYVPKSVVSARTAGVEIVTQETGLVGALTVAENFNLGRNRAAAKLSEVLARRQTDDVLRALATVAPHVSPRALASSLPLDQQKLVELARALHFVQRVLLVDEMSAVLDRDGLQVLFRALRAERERGTAILYISHYLEEVAELCDRVSVLRDGQLVATLPIAEAGADRLSTLMVGREVAADLYPEISSGDPAEEPLFTASRLSVDGEFCDVDFSVARGEILGIGGLMGCGSSVLARALFGDQKLDSGQMTLAGHPYAPSSPREAIKRRVAYVPPDREREGLILRLPIGSNVTLAALPELSRWGLYAGKGERRRVADLVDLLSIRCQGAADLPLSLSGGNRQKVVFAKWLLTDIDLFILHNPTRGVDIGAKAEIYALMKRLADKGAGIVLISDEMPELIGMSNRIVILRRGQISHVVDHEQHPDEHSLITHMI